MKYFLYDVETTGFTRRDEVIQFSGYLLTRRLQTDGYTVIGQPRLTGDGFYESTILDPEGNNVEITE